MSDTGKQLREIRRQVEAIDRYIAQLQHDWPIAWPARRVRHEDSDRSLEEFQKPGRPGAVEAGYVLPSGPERQSAAAFMHKNSFDMSIEPERKEYGRRVRRMYGKD